MRRIAVAATLVAALAGVAPALPSEVARTTVYAAPFHFFPGGRDTPIPLTVRAGEPLDLVVVDAAGWHRIESSGHDAGGSLLFWSEFIGFGMTARVHGVERLAPGAYGFYCPLHFESMWATLTVVN